MDRAWAEAWDQCDQTWRHFATLAKFVQLLKALFTIWQTFEPILATFYAIGQIYIPINGQILKNSLAICSHCLRLEFLAVIKEVQISLKVLGKKLLPSTERARKGEGGHDINCKDCSTPCGDSSNYISLSLLSHIKQSFLPYLSRIEFRLRDEMLFQASIEC